MKITKPGVDTKKPPSFAGVTVVCHNCTCAAVLDATDIVHSCFEKGAWQVQTDCPTENCGGQLKGSFTPGGWVETKTT